ncbi:hypothetical protein POV27_18010 [Aureisphaera galaxeae]|uniref:hypothetical protein n=1 Tax=Aureisphaera galaxeae TaxID=1538023 RepID=UPI0023508B05|nr:hypothetical protein [Aureisphaera galaxeae]MDC8005953.1 hypothetical protein [Aureisphaera galaxeae]
MKRLLLAIFALALLVACKDNPVSEKIKETRENVSNTQNAFKELNEMQEDLEKLKEITPLTNEEFKDWLPDEVKGMKRTKYKAGQGSYMNLATIEATYASEDKSKQFKIQVIDGAGEMGAAATAAMRIMFSQDFEEETEYKTKRTVERKGVKAVEEYSKSNNRSTIQFMQDDRFYFHVNGLNMDMDETWDAIQDLDPEDLG